MEAILELAASLREEVRERACRLLTRFLGDPSCSYFTGKPDARDSVFRRVEPLLRDESAAVRYAAAEFTCACVLAIGIPSAPMVRAELLRPYLPAVADYLLHESDDAAREPIEDLVRKDYGIASVLKKLYPRQPTLDAFVVKRRRKRRRRSKPAVERPPCVSP